MEDLDELVRKLLTKVREIKIDIITQNTELLTTHLETAINLTDEIYAELYTLKLKLEKQNQLS